MTTPQVFTLSRANTEARLALVDGYITRDGRRIGVRAVEVLARAGGHEDILFREVDRVSATTTREKIRRSLIAIRAISLTATLMPCLAVLADGLRRGETLNKFAAVSALMGVLLLQIAINLYNDVSDYVKLIDLPGTPGGSGAFNRGWVTPKEVLAYARSAAVLAVVCGIPSLLSYPREILTIGLLGLAGTLLYSNERIGLKYHALGDFTVLVLCGPALTAGYSLAAFGKLAPSFLAIGIFLGLLACGLLHVNNLQDIEFDRSRGASTLASRVGFTNSVRILFAIEGLAFLVAGLAIAGKILPIGAMVVGIAAVPAWKLLRKVAGSLGPTCPTLFGVRIEAAQLHLLSGALLTAGIVVSSWMKL
jgi:1,4-dihydroxy-2-naphthoate octaprenyltransferase